MAKKANVKQLTSNELFKLAEARKQEEAEILKETQRAKLEAAKQERKQMLARHRKELAAMDAKIGKLGGRPRTAKRKRSTTNVTETVFNIVAASKSISTNDIKAELHARGIVANNLSQTLAYLKRQGKITSPSRSVYAPA